MKRTQFESIHQHKQIAIDRPIKQKNHFRQKQNESSQINRNYSPKIISQNISKNHSNIKREDFTCLLENQINEVGKRYAYIKNKNNSTESEQQSHASILDSNDDNHFLQRIYNRGYNLVKNGKLQKQKEPINTEKNYSNQKNSIQNDFSQESWEKDSKIKNLEIQLEEEKNKFKLFQQQTIQNQIKVLQTINNMEIKLKSVHQENSLLKQKNLELTQSLQRQYSLKNLQNLLHQKQTQLQQLTKQHKKIKAIGKGIVEMMKKVDLLQAPKEEDQVKFAWRWLKKVVWQYEGIRKKALQWKVAYEQLNQDSVDSQDN